MKASSDFPSMNAKKPEGVNAGGEPFRILLIDDSIFVRKQLTQILSSEGFKIVGEADNGVDGFSKYKEIYPNVDLVTMDITMPQMDGITCLEKIMEFDPKARIVMISALGKEDLVKKALVIGAKNYIVKPLDRAKVLERIVSAVK